MRRHAMSVMCKQTIDAAEIDERAVVGEVLDHTFDFLAFLQRRQQRFAFDAVLLFQHRTTRHHDIVASLVELDDFELERLAFEVRGFAQRADVDERTRQECADVGDVDGEAAFDLAVDDAGDDRVLLERLFEHHPRLGAACFLARKTRFAEAVVDDFHRDFDLVADLELEVALVVDELNAGYDPFGFQSGVYNDPVAVDVHHRAGHDGARRHLDGVQAFFKEIRKTFAHAK